VSALVDPESERAILGSILVSNAHITTAEEWLRAEHFGVNAHRRIFSAMSRMSEDGQGIDLVSLRYRLAADGSLAEAGGVEYLAGLLDGLPRVSGVEEWARIIHDRARRRAAKVLGERLANIAESDLGTEELLDQHAAAFQRIMESGDVARATMPFVEALRLAEANIDRHMAQGGLTGVPSGLSDLDRFTGGWQKGALIIVAARPAGGKSVLCGQVAAHAASKGHRGLVFSMEMPPEAMAERMWFSEASMSRWELAHKSDGWESMQRAYGRLATIPLTFDRRESPTLAQIRAAVKREKVRSGVDFVVVDYLQRVDFDPKLEERIGVGRTAQGLKSLARMLEVPVIAACQLSRAAENKEPTLSDLAESGKIEREADIVLFLHPDPDTRGAALDFPTVHAILGKHRAGQCGRVKLSFEKKFARMVQMADTAVEWRGNAV
jgi:replicative DNA helicase